MGIATTQALFLEEKLQEKGHAVSVPFDLEESEYKYTLALIYNNRDEELEQQLKRLNLS